MKVITLLNEKGGVGKTTWSAHIAEGLAARGKRVVVIDLDPQGHATKRLGQGDIPGTFNFFIRDESWEHTLIPIEAQRFSEPGERLSRGKLWVMPGNRETRFIGVAELHPFILAKRLQEIEGQVDVVVIDTAPTASPLHALAYMATNYLVCPTEPAFLSMDGLVKSMIARQVADKTRVAQMKQNGWSADHITHINVGGIIPTKVKTQANEHKENIEQLKAFAGDLVWPAITNSVIWDTSSAYQLPVFNLEPRHKAAHQVWQVIDRVEGVLNA